MSPQLSIVIPVYDNWWLTARCLVELERLRRRGTVSFETIVVDNASSDETPDAITAFPWVRYVRHEENRNFAGACNSGVRSAQTPLTLLLNNDAFSIDDALTPLVRAFDRDDVAIAGGALFFEDLATQAAGLVVLRNAHWHYYCRNLPAPDVARPRDALGVSGAAMVVRTAWFLESGGFDESFINGFEDVDLCMRARAQGRVVAYVPEARFVHYEAASAGRFAREAANERLFYERWAGAMGALPRTARGEVGAIAVRSSARSAPLTDAALADLEAALREFGHPIVHGRIAPWRRVDRRFRKAATLAWFRKSSAKPAIAIERNARSVAVIRTRGAVALEVPWLPCAAAERVTACRVRVSDDPWCRIVAVAGDLPEIATDELGGQLVSVTPEMLLGDGPTLDVACVVHAGWTDDAAFGNVLLAQAGVPAIAIDREEIRAIVAVDVAIYCAPGELRNAVTCFTGDVEQRRRYSRLIAGDSKRRFSPRRSAIRVVDLLCAARFGLERPGKALRNTPL